MTDLERAALVTKGDVLDALAFWVCGCGACGDTCRTVSEDEYTESIRALTAWEVRYGSLEALSDVVKAIRSLRKARKSA